MHPDVALNVGAHLVGAGGGIVDGEAVASREALAATLPALRLRLQRFLAICVDHVEREFNKVWRLFVLEWGGGIVMVSGVVGLETKVEMRLVRLVQECDYCAFIQKNKV